MTARGGRIMRSRGGHTVTWWALLIAAKLANLDKDVLVLYRPLHSAASRKQRRTTTPLLVHASRSCTTYDDFFKQYRDNSYNDGPRVEKIYAWNWLNY